VSRAAIDQAIGIIRSGAGSAEDAFDRLRRISQSKNTSTSP
jgi:ANTAR domain